MKYDEFETTFLNSLNIHAPVKTKTVRANHKPYFSRELRKAIMRRSFLENKYHKNPSAERLRAYKKHKNYTSRLAKKAKINYFENLNLKSISDNKSFLQAHETSSF